MHALSFDISIQSCSKVAPKVKSCSKLLKSKQVAQNAKSCLKVDEQNLLKLNGKCQFKAVMFQIF